MSALLRTSAASCSFALALSCGGGTTTATTTTPTNETPTTASNAGPNGVRLERPTSHDPLREPQAVILPTATPVVTIRVVFYTGSSDDTPGAEGITNLTARMMAEGGAGDLSYAEREQRLFPTAGQISVQVDRDQTVFIGRVPVAHFEAFYGLFRDVLVAPQFAENDFDRVKSAVQTELERELRGNNDEQLGKELLQAMIYEGHPYMHPPLGTSTGLAELTLDDLRVHYTNVFCGSRSIVGIAGGGPPDLEDRVRNDLLQMDTESCAGRQHLPAPVSRSARVWLIEKPEAAAVAVSMGVPLDVRRGEPDYPALLLAAAYLGQHRQFTGVLMRHMRGDRGLNYGDYAYAEHFAQDGWSHFPLANIARRQQFFSIWVRPVRRDQAHFAIRMAVRELRALVDRGLTERDFQTTREFISQYYALMLQTDSRRIGYALDDRFYEAAEPWLEALRTAWANLTVAQVNAAIRRHIDPTRLQMAVIASGASALADALASEAESPITYPTTPAQTVLDEDREIVGYRIGIPRSAMAIIPLAETFR